MKSGKEENESKGKIRNINKRSEKRRNVPIEVPERQGSVVLVDVSCYVVQQLPVFTHTQTHTQTEEHAVKK